MKSKYTEPFRLRKPNSVQSCKCSRIPCRSGQLALPPVPYSTLERKLVAGKKVYVEYK